MPDTTVGPVGPARQRPATGEQPLPVPRRVVVTGNVAAPPPRPRVGSDLPPPRLQADRRPRTLDVAARLWWAAAAAAVITVVAAVLDRAALDERLTALALESDPGASAGAVAAGVRATLVLVLGGTALLALLSLAWLRLVLRRRSWARWALLATALPALVLADVTQSVVAGGLEVDRVAAICQAGLVLGALVPLWLRPTRTWLQGSGDRPAD
jgi:uncharacterized membrane protein